MEKSRRNLLLLAVAAACFTAAVAPAAAHHDRFPGELAVLEFVQSIGWFGPIAHFFDVPVQTWIIRILTGAGVAWSLWRRDLPHAGAFALLWPGYLLNSLVKTLVDRPRPEGDFDIAHVPSTAAFPSGHAFDAAAFSLIVALAASREALPPAARRAIYAAGMATVILAAVSRVWLGLHWPSDVVAGSLLGAAYGALLWTIAGSLAGLPQLARLQRAG